MTKNISAFSSRSAAFSRQAMLHLHKNGARVFQIGTIKPTTNTDFWTLNGQIRV